MKNMFGWSVRFRILAHNSSWFCDFFFAFYASFSTNEKLNIFELQYLHDECSIHDWGVKWWFNENSRQPIVSVFFFLIAKCFLFPHCKLSHFVQACMSELIFFRNRMNASTVELHIYEWYLLIEHFLPDKRLFMEPGIILSSHWLLW